MSAPSKWPLPDQGIRFLTPTFMVRELHRHPLTRECFPTALGYYPRALNHRMKRSRHDDNLIIYCVDGNGRLSADERHYEVARGDLVLLPQGLPHEYAASDETPWTIYWSHFQGIGSNIFMDYLGYREETAVVRAGLAPGLQAAFSNLLAVRHTGYSTLAFINAANQLRHLLTQFALETNRSRAQGTGHLDLESLQDYMRENVHRQLELDDLAAVANLSKFHFSNRYKSLTGYSPIKHFQHMKIEYACRLLDGSDMSVKAIAAELGYADPLYFSRLFHRIMGMPPRSYRNSIRK